ncbi:MAG TPA: hypothetical protein VGH77_22915 [Streptosporangiaceae bacterium]|jgi:hypothetical protein
MVSWLGHAAPARRLTLPMPLPPGTSGMLMRPAHRGIDADLPADRPGRIRSPLQPGDDPRPGAITLPAAEILNSDSAKFGGSNTLAGAVTAEPATG